MRDLAAGQEIKEKKFTVRVNSRLYNQLRIEAEQNKISISECARWRLENKGVEINIIPKLCRLLTTINSVMDKYEIKDEDKKLIGTEVTQLWQLLN